MQKLILIISLLASTVYAKTDIKVMTFNTMCDFCKGSKKYNFEKRLQIHKKIIQKHSPDLISLQEYRSGSQIQSIIDTQKYDIYYHKIFNFIDYSDAAIVFDKSKFKLLDKGYIWLGPSNGFSFGWKFALPRIMIWVKLESIQDQKSFYFISSHLDNRIENLAGSAKKINHFLKERKLPYIFAADTNMTTDMSEYQTLTSHVLKNSFTKLDSNQINKNLCYTRKGDIFPACKVDHILVSLNDNWTFGNTMIDTTMYNSELFPSDHRPVIVELSLLP